MNIQTMQLEFRQASDKLESSVLSDLLPENIDYLLNEAISRYVKMNYLEYEKTGKDFTDIRTLVVTHYPAVSINTNEVNTYILDLSTIYTDEANTILSTDLFWFYIRGRVKTNKTNCNSQYVFYRVYQHDDIDQVLLNPFKKPILTDPVAYIEGNNFMLLTDGTFTIDKSKVTYIKKPAEVRYGSLYPTPVSNIDCDLPESTHKEIVALAVNIGLEELSDPRLQTKLGLDKGTVIN